MKVADVTGDLSRRRPSASASPTKDAEPEPDGKADLVTVIHDRIIVYPQD